VTKHKLAILILCCGAAIPAAAQLVGVFEGNTDVGVTPQKGKAEFAGGEYRITGGGANVWGAVDAFHYVWTRMSGDVALSADVRFIGPGAVAHRKVTLMIRQSLDPDSAYAGAALHGDGLTSLQFRPAAAAETKEVKQEAMSDLSAPVRLRIERRGDNFVMLAGKPGGQLTSTGPAPTALTGPVYVGIAVCSHDANVLETAVLSNVTLQALPPAAANRPPVQRYRSRMAI